MTRKLNKYLVVALVLILATIIRLYPIYQYSLEASSYTGVQESNINYILESGYSISSARGEVLLNILDAIKVLIINLTAKQSLVITSLLQSLSFSLVVLLFSKPLKNKLNLGLISLIIMFSVSAIPGIISRLSGWNGPYAWIFYLSSFYIVLCKDKTPLNILLSLFFLCLLPLTYYTEANIIYIILVVALIFKICFKKSIFSLYTILIYSVFFLSWLMYMSLNGFSGMLRILSFFQSYYAEESRFIGLSYIAGQTLMVQLKNGIPVALSSIPFIYCIIKGKDILDRKIHDFLLIVFCSICLLSIAFFLWMGIAGVLQRIPLLIAIFSIISFPLLVTSRIQKVNLKSLVLVVILTLISSNIVYITYSYPPSNLSFGEAGGTHWLMAHMSKEQLVFTDFRISAPFTAKGYHTSIINDAALSYGEVNDMLEKIYYNKGSPVEALQKINSKGGKVKYLFFTKRSSELYPGIKGFDYNFLPASKNFVDTYDDLSEFNVIYRNNDVTILISQL